MIVIPVFGRRHLLLAAIPMLCAQTPPSSSATILSELRSGKYAEAKQLLDQALIDSPNDVHLWTLNGYALSHLGSGQPALAAYRRALEISPEYLPALEGAAELEYKASDQAAVPLLKTILKLHPDDITSHAMLAALAYRRRDCDNAVKEFSECKTLIWKKTSALGQYGSCLVRLKRAPEAIPVFERIIDLEPDNERAHYNLAVVDSLAGRHQHVIGILTELVKKEPNDADSLDLLAEAYEAVSDTPHAVTSLRQAIVAAPEVPGYYVDFANISLAHESYQVGVDMLNAGLRRIPDAASLYLARGILYVQMGKYEESEQDFTRAEQLDPTLEYGSAARGLVELQQNNLEQAEAKIRNRIRASPDNAFLRYLLSETLVRKGAAVGSAEFQEALQSAQKAVQLQPQFALGRDVLGRLYLEEDKTEEAIEESRLAFEDDPADQTALYHLILALRKSKRSSEIPKLARKLGELREQARAKDAAEHKYALIETGAGATNSDK
jgi:tetratricopeptide (TPR) repeat protein